MKAGEGNPQAWEKEGKLSLLSMERCSSLAGIPGILGLEFHGKAAAFTTPIQSLYITHHLFLSDVTNEECSCEVSLPAMVVLHP